MRKWKKQNAKINGSDIHRLGNNTLWKVYYYGWRSAMKYIHCNGFKLSFFKTTLFNLNMSYDLVGAVVAGLVALIGIIFSIYQYRKGSSNQL